MRLPPGLGNGLHGLLLVALVASPAAPAPAHQGRVSPTGETTGGVLRFELPSAPSQGQRPGGLPPTTDSFLGRVLAGCQTDIVMLNQVTGWQIRWPRELSRAPVSTAGQRRALLDRWQQAPAVLASARGVLEESLRAGTTAPRAVARRVLAQIDGLLASGDHSGLWSPGERAGSPEFAARWRSLMEDRVVPAITAFRSFLTERYLPAARAGLGLGARSEAASSCYLDAVEAWTRLRPEPQRIRELGRSLLASLERELLELAAPEYGATPGEILDSLRRGDLPGAFQSRSEVVEHAEAALERARLAAPEWFGTPGERPLEVRPMPRESEGSSAAGRYLPPSGRSGPGVYLLNTSRPEERRLLSETIAFHEGIPGHHTSFAVPLAAGNGRGGFDSGFIEGWGTYAERLAEEMGLYSSRLDRIGMLTKRMWAASRLVVDPGIHLEGRSREWATDFMSRHTALGPTEIAIEVDRYAALPGQSLAYMLGYLHLRRLREEAERALGEAFDIREFHDVVLVPGVRPLPRVEADVRAWIRRSGSER